MAWATLRRHPARTTLAMLGIAVAAALLLDMVMLATGMSESFRSLLLTRGYQLRVSPKGTLPFDSEATIDGAGAIVRALRANPDVKAVSPTLGATLTIDDSRIPSAFALGLERDVQGDYTLEAGTDVTPTDSVADGGTLAPLPRIVVSQTFLTRAGHAIGDTLTISSGLDAQLRTAARSSRVVIGGMGRFIYVPGETPVLALDLALLRQLLGPSFRDRMSLAMADSRFSLGGGGARMDCHHAAPRHGDLHGNSDPSGGRTALLFPTVGVRARRHQSRYRLPAGCHARHVVGERTTW